VLDPVASVGPEVAGHRIQLDCSDSLIVLRENAHVSLFSSSQCRCDSIVGDMTDVQSVLRASSAGRHAQRAVVARRGVKNLHVLPFDVSMSVSDAPMVIDGAPARLRQIKKLGKTHRN